MKRVRFWGTRGSLPVALTAAGVRTKLRLAVSGAQGRTFADDGEIDAYLDSLGFAVAGTYGGNSPCVEIETGRGEYVLCDAGSGLRAFAQAAMARHGARAPQTYHLLMSHLHWDHIMGFPFFTPAYVPGNRIRIYGAHDELESAFRRQQAAPSFPVDFAALGADIAFVHLDPDVEHEVAGLKVRMLRQRHAGDSYGYRLEGDGRAVVYTTDSEHKLEELAETQRFVDFFRAADLVVFDAMYSLAESISVKADWGHSSNVVGVELCQMAGVRHLCLFHHEPVNDDAAIDSALQEARRYAAIARRAGDPLLEVSAAYDGMEFAL
jgi:phosphoribosyl 1,2-cyclic phosphodiesterase